MRSKRSSSTTNRDLSAEVAHHLAATTIHSQETQTLPKIEVEVEQARARALGRALADSSNQVALHERPTMLLPTISASDRIEVGSDELSAELLIEPQDVLADEVAALRREREELLGKVATLEHALATERVQLLAKQRAMELLLPWLPTDEGAPSSTVSCSEVLKRIEPLQELLKRARNSPQQMSDQDQVRGLLIDAEAAVTELRKLCGES